MKYLVRSIAAVLAIGASTAALAAPPTVPPQPAPVPSGGLSNNGTTDPLYVTVYDPITGVSLTEYTGLNASQIGPSDMTASLNFGTLSGFSSTFAGDTDPLQFEVFSTATTGGGNVTSVYTTSRNAASNALFDATAANAGTVAGNIAGANSAVNNWTTAVFNAGAPNCAKVNPCIATGSSDPRSFANAALFGDNYAGTLAGYGSAAHTSGALGTGMNFYLLTADNTDPFNPAASATKYVGTFDVSTAGVFTYDVGGSTVPLPAAAWLLISGLAGLGTMGRRRSAAQSAA